MFSGQYTRPLCVCVKNFYVDYLTLGAEATIVGKLNMKPTINHGRVDSFFKVEVVAYDIMKKEEV